MLVATIVTYKRYINKRLYRISTNKADRIVVDGNMGLSRRENASTDGTLEYLSGLNIEILFSYGLDEVEKETAI